MIDVFLSGLGSGITGLLIMVILRDFGHLPVARSFSALLVAVLAFLINPLMSEGWGKLTRDIQTMIPALFWLTSRLAFSDRPAQRTWILVPAAYTFLAPFLAGFYILHTDATGWIRLVGWNLPQLFEFILIFLGLHAVVADWRSDLVESRRKLRVIVMTIVGVTILGVVTSMNFQFGENKVRFLLCILALSASAWFLLQGRKGVLFGASLFGSSEEAQRKQRKSRDLSQDLLKLHQIMNDGFYRTEQITLKLLATRIEVPEYKCRSLINQELGYRNFNEYINELRIKEACQRLLAEPETPISNISLDVGYRTLSSFNRAFKELCKCSPTDYRNGKHNDKTE
ncbi:MAG: AraC family transcriptional regulator [Pseudomonadales bacterium]|nr:AraC family transcriptional regulator [Pseudomonadales bacterium]